MPIEPLGAGADAAQFPQALSIEFVDFQQQLISGGTDIATELGDLAPEFLGTHITGVEKGFDGCHEGLLAWRLKCCTNNQ